MRKLLDKLLMLISAAAILTTIGPVAQLYDNHLQTYWLEKSLHHTIILDIRSPDGDRRGTASGVIVDNVPRIGAPGCSLLVLTAYHNTHLVVDVPGAADLPMNVKLINGAESLLVGWDANEDLALLWFDDSKVKDCHNWTAADLATQNPPLGGNVWATGFPSRVPHLVRGTYAGAETMRFNDSTDHNGQYVFSTGPGASGGGVWYKGRLVGIILQKSRPNVITSAVWVANIDAVRSFLDNAPL